MHKQIPYAFHKGLILRTPAFPFVPARAGEGAETMLNDPYFLEAVYLASPVLYDECIKLAGGQIDNEKEKTKILQSAMKYWQRMYSRCTPFGLFSGCSAGEWHTGETHIVINTEKRQRHTRLDMHFLCALSQHLATLPDIKSRLRFFPNNSWYKTSDEIRYIEYRYVNGNRHHQISAAAASEYLEDILQHAANGITIAGMVQVLLPYEVTEEEALEFIDELLNSQVLVNELEPAITGPEFIYQLLDTLTRLNQPENETINNIINILRQIDARLQQIDRHAANPVSAYKEIIEWVKQTGVAFEESKLFQTDMVQFTETATVNETHQQELLEALEFLNGYSGNTTGNENMSGFAQRFYERYEDKEMPLLQVLDAETGIGYLQQSGRNPSVLIEDIYPGPPAEEPPREIKWGKTQGWLLNKLQDATRNNLYEVDITAEDVKDFKATWNNLPPSVSIMFRLVNGKQVVFESAGSSSAANLLSRFAHGDERIRTIICDITRQEQEKNPDIVFAEIVHLPESRVGNILLHPVFRDYEIPFLAKSALPAEQQVDLRDLYVSVQGSRVTLRSATLNKEIIPRLSSAHNFSYNALPVYQFLCDLQSNTLRQGFGFQWGQLSNHFRFLPRVTYKNIILHEAAWQLNKPEIEKFTQALKQPDAAFIKELRLPRFITLSDGDNELLTDLENTASVDALLKTIKNRPAIVLKEFITGTADGIADVSGAPYINQFVAALVKTETVYTPQPVTAAGDTPRHFVPGSEWLYYKIYCGVNTAEKVLDNWLEPAIRQMETQQLIDKWFFIRYADPGAHLRIRFRVKNAAARAAVEALLAEPFIQLQKEGICWRIQSDTYNRELERYGGALIEEAETLFCIDSNLKLAFLRQTEGDDREKIRWLWGMKNADWMLNGFGLTPAEKEAVLLQAKEQFGREFNFGKNALQEINKKFSKHRNEIMSVMEPAPDTEMLVPQDMFAEQETAMQAVAENIKTRSGQKGEALASWLHSYLHMCLNRLFPAEPRLQEAVMYEFLYKYYVSLRYRK